MDNSTLQTNICIFVHDLNKNKYINKPDAQAKKTQSLPDATKQSQPIQQNRRNFWTNDAVVMSFET